MLRTEIKTRLLDSTLFCYPPKLESYIAPLTGDASPVLIFLECLVIRPGAEEIFAVNEQLVLDSLVLVSHFATSESAARR